MTFLFSVTGCGPRVPRTELGEIRYEVPDVPGMKEPYTFPDGTEAKQVSELDPP
jgi:hypothetical protein